VDTVTIPKWRKNKRPRLDRALYGPGGRPNDITIDTVGRRPFFARGQRLAELAMTALVSTAVERKVQLYCYCLMPHHLHLVARVLPEGMDLITFVQYLKSQLKRASVGLFSGDLWQRSLHDRFLWTEKELVDTCAYILNNPVRVGIVDTWRLYPFTYLASELH